MRITFILNEDMVNQETMHATSLAPERNNISFDQARGYLSSCRSILPETLLGARTSLRRPICEDMSLKLSSLWCSGLTSGFLLCSLSTSQWSSETIFHLTIRFDQYSGPLVSCIVLARYACFSLFFYCFFFCWDSYNMRMKSTTTLCHIVSVLNAIAGIPNILPYTNLK